MKCMGSCIAVAKVNDFSKYRGRAGRIVLVFAKKKFASHIFEFFMYFYTSVELRLITLEGHLAYQFSFLLDHCSFYEIKMIRISKAIANFDEGLGLIKKFLNNSCIFVNKFNLWAKQ